MREGLIATTAAIMLILAGGILWNANASSLGCHRYRTTHQCRQSVVQVRGDVRGALIGSAVPTGGADALPVAT
jgi:hypothetical protein